MTDDVVTADELAERLSISSAAVRWHCRHGRIAGARKVGVSWAIPAVAADAFAEQYTPQLGGRRPGQKRADVDRSTPPADRSAPARTTGSPDHTP